MPILNNIVNARIGALGVASIRQGNQLVWPNFPVWQTNNLQGELFMRALRAYVVGKTFAQTTATFGNLIGVEKWFGGVLAPNGKVYGIPYDSTQVLEIDPINQTTALFGSLSATGNKWLGGVLAPNGKIYGIPRNATQVLEIDPVAQTTALFGSLSGMDKWLSCALAPNGKIYGIPSSATQILEIDPVAQTTALFGSLIGANKWIGAVLAPNGTILAIPYISTQVLQIGDTSAQLNDFVLSRYVNKY